MAFFKYPEGQSYLNVDKAQFKEILENKEALEGRALYLVDLRSNGEIEKTGLIGHAGVQALHIPIAAFDGALDMNDEEFTAKYGVPKPNKDNDVLVFSCAAGGRSARASGIAATKGYKNIANYTGGANDWF